MKKYFIVFLLFLSISTLYSSNIKVFYVVDAREFSLSDRLTMVSLQGIVNRVSKDSGLFVVLRGEDVKWLQDIKNRREFKIITLSKEEALKKYKKEIKGIIIYDPNKSYTINISTTLAGIKDAVITKTEIPGFKVIFDCRNRWKNKIEAYKWAINNLLQKTTKEMSAILEEHITSLRDFIIQNKVFVFDLDPINNKEEIKLIEKILSYYTPNTPIVGWPDAKYADPKKGQNNVSVEVAFVKLISPRNIFLVASDFACNLSIYKKLSSKIPFIQVRKKEFYDPDKVYITFVYSDGDNIQYVLNHMRAGLWDDKYRLKLPIGWTIAPLLYKWGGFILEKYYSDAYFSENDEFVMGPSGFGYVHPAKYKDINTFLKFTEKYVKLLDLNSVAIIDEGTLQEMLNTYKKFANQTSLETIFLVGNYGYRNLLRTDNSAIWVLSEDFRANFVENNVNEIKKLVRSGRKMIYCYAHAWDIPPSQLYEIIKKVSDLNVKVVLPSTFSDLLYQRLIKINSNKNKEEKYRFFEAEKRVIYNITYNWIQYNKINLIKFNLQIDSSRVFTSQIVYWFENNKDNKYFQYLRFKGNNEYTVTLPPIYKGKKIKYYISVITKDLKIKQTSVKEIKIPFYSDRDKDGLSDNFEINISKTSPDSKDTDVDGLYDAVDNDPLRKLKNEKVIYIISKDNEVKFLWKDYKSLKAPDGHRYADNDAYFIYKLPINKKVISPKLALLLDNNYVVEISKDGKNFKKVFSSPYDCHDSGNKGWKIINLSSDYFKESYIYVKISDGSPEDGWGGGCYGIKLLGKWGDVKILDVVSPEKFLKNKKNKIVIYEANIYPLKDIEIKINNKIIKDFIYNRDKQYIKFYFIPDKEGKYNLNIKLKDEKSNIDAKSIILNIKFKNNNIKSISLFNKIKIKGKKWSIFDGWKEGECGENEELRYIYKDKNSAIDNLKHRFTDGNNYVIYKFYSPLDIGVLRIKIGNDYIVSISTNNSKWYKLLDSYEIYGKYIHDLSNYEEHILNISSYLKTGKYFYIKIEDKTKNDGWGGNIGYIKFGIPPIYKHKERVTIGVRFNYNNIKAYIKKGKLIKHIIYPKEGNPLFTENFDSIFNNLFVFSIPSNIMEDIYKINIVAQYKGLKQEKALYIGVYNKKLKYTKQNNKSIKKITGKTNKTTILEQFKGYFRDFGKVDNINSFIVSKEFVENNKLSCYFLGWGTGHCGTENETKYLIYKNSGSINPLGMRFADGTVMFGYKFKLPQRWRKIVLQVDVGNNFIVEVYNTKLNRWIEVLNSQEMYKEDIHNMSNYKAYYLNLTDFISHRRNIIKIRFKDGSTNDGWGACVGNIKIFIK